MIKVGDSLNPVPQCWSRRMLTVSRTVAPDPKPKKNRELKTEILPVPVATTPQLADPHPVPGTPEG